MCFAFGADFACGRLVPILSRSARVATNAAQDGVERASGVARRRGAPKYLQDIARSVEGRVMAPALWRAEPRETAKERRCD